MALLKALMWLNAPFVVPFQHFSLQTPAIPVGIWHAKAAIATEDIRIAILERPVLAVPYDGMTHRHRRAPGGGAISVHRPQIERHGKDENGHGQNNAHRRQSSGCPVVLTPRPAKMLH
ncbi:MAG TPA: hypothetical protein VGF02_03875 [Pseudolabrys sp.]|jgi:hypothetical protein